MRLAAVIAPALAASLIAACSAVPEPDASLRPGYHAHAYVLTVEEHGYDCKSLAFVIAKSVETINEMPAQAKKQRDAPPASVVHAVQRVSGNGIPVLEDYKRERARLKALELLGHEKGCPSVDVDGQTKEAAEKLATFRKQLHGGA